jgi:hypothetical protein
LPHHLAGLTRFGPFAKKNFFLESEEITGIGHRSVSRLQAVCAACSQKTLAVDDEKAKT